MFCRNCGADVGSSKFCPNCGTNINETSNDAAVASVPKAKKPFKRSLSFILFAVLSGSAIGLLFVPNYTECLFEQRYKGTTIDAWYAEESFWNFSSSDSSVILGIIAIILISLPFLFSLINFFAKKRAIAIINNVTASVSLVYILLLSILESENHYSSFSGFLGTTNIHVFHQFGVIFYIILAIALAMCVISIFDTINKPILKVSDK
ncbi:MAG: zinc ribbon domain-containing protein [Clostridia bacterium]|nr:zinc ribbon domain-containing protein [Clostridia bacterium]